MNRSLAVTAVAFVACIALVPALVATGASAQQGDNVTAIDSCTNITEPGEYELVDDVQTDEAGACISIQADNVVLDGNGYVLEGSGENEHNIAIDHHSGPSTVIHGTEIRNIKIVGWNEVLYQGASVEIANTVFRNNGRGPDLVEGDFTLTDVIIENNTGPGLSAQRSEVNGTNVTIRGNHLGLGAMDGGDYTFESARIVNNNGTGAGIQHYSSLELTNSTVRGNNGHGITTFPASGGSRVTLENTTVADNAGDGIGGWGDSSFYLDRVTFENNAGPAVHTFSGAYRSSSINATAFSGGPAITLTVDGPLRPTEGLVQLDPVARSNLEPRDDGTLVGDGLNVSGNLSNAVEWEMDVATDEETVDLWRYDGSQWETVEEDLPVTDGSITASVAENGTFAPGIMADEANADEHILTIESTESTPAMHYRIVSTGPIEAGEDLEDHDDFFEEDGNWVVEGQVGPSGTDNYHVTTEELESFGVWYIDVDDPVNYTDDPVPADTFSLQWNGEEVHPDDIAAETDVGEEGEEADDSDESDDADESNDDEADDSERSDDPDTSEDDSRDDADGSDDTDESDDDSQDGADETDGSNESDGTEESDDEETGDEEVDNSDETGDFDSTDDQETDDEETDDEADDSRDESDESDDDQPSDEESTDEDGEAGDDETAEDETVDDETDDNEAADEDTDDDKTEADEQTESGDDETGGDGSVDDDSETGDDGEAAIDDEADTLTPAVPESDPVLGEEGPGFGVIAALVAVVSAGLLAYLRREI